uniref:Uncharacterized protein n=1 Tax=Anguilla anguilla TaxID=7936 RepID=A0A0E9V7R6_ANGAN
MISKQTETNSPIAYNNFDFVLNILVLTLLQGQIQYFKILV